MKALVELSIRPRRHRLRRSPRSRASISARARVRPMARTSAIADSAPASEAKHMVGRPRQIGRGVDKRAVEVENHCRQARICPSMLGPASVSKPSRMSRGHSPVHAEDAYAMKPQPRQGGSPWTSAKAKRCATSSRTSRCSRTNATSTANGWAGRRGHRCHQSRQRRRHRRGAEARARRNRARPSKPPKMPRRLGRQNRQGARQRSCANGTT